MTSTLPARPPPPIKVPQPGLPMDRIPFDEGLLRQPAKDRVGEVVIRTRDGQGIGAQGQHIGVLGLRPVVHQVVHATPGGPRHIVAGLSQRPDHKGRGR